MKTSESFVSLARRLCGRFVPTALLLTVGLSAPTLRAQLPSGYTLAFSDEFNTTSVDTTKWQYRHDGKALSQQQAANVSESGGLLHVALLKQTVGSFSYTGGGVISIGHFRYGYYEARVKSPPGAGWHSSFWSMGYDGSGTGTSVADQEIDFYEQNSGGLGTYNTNYFKWNPTPSAQIGNHNGSGVTPDFSNFHVISALFTPTRVIFYLDGVQHYATTDLTSYPSQNDANIWLTCIGYTSPIDDTKLPAEFQCDWVHYYAPPAGVQPAVPAGLTATAGLTGHVPLSWSASSGAATYSVKRATISGGPYTSIGSTAALSYDDTTVTNGTTYFYTVSAVSSAPLESNDSAQATAAAGTSIIQDNADASGVVITGTWGTSTYNTGYYASNYIQDNDTGSTGGKSVKFTPTITTAGTYAVYLNWAGAANRATNTPVDVSNGTTTTTYSVNQQSTANWVLLGTVSLSAGTAGYVKVRDDGANGYVIGDAVKFVLQ